MQEQVWLAGTETEGIMAQKMSQQWYRDTGHAHEDGNINTTDDKQQYDHENWTEIWETLLNAGMLIVLSEI